MRTTARLGRRTLAVAALATPLLLVPAGADAAPPLPDLEVAPPPSPAFGASLDLTAGIGDIYHGVEIADDAVYYTVETVGRSHQMWEAFMGLYGRSRATTGAGTTLGRAQLLDRIPVATLFAEHDGTLAYVQASTGRAVLRAPDGTITEEAWADSPAVAGGVSGFSDSWLVGADHPYEPSYSLVNRSTGTGYDLANLVTIPGGFHWAFVTSMRVTETQVAWSVYAESTTDMTGSFTGVYTAPLTADGPGTVTVLATAASSDPATYTGVDLVALDGTRLFWSATSRSRSAGGPCTTTLSWYDARPYAGTPASLPVGCSWVIGVEGTTVVTDQLGAWDPGVLSWRELSGSGTPFASQAYLGTQGGSRHARRHVRDRGGLHDDRRRVGPPGHGRPDDAAAAGAVLRPARDRPVPVRDPVARRPGHRRRLRRRHVPAAGGGQP